MKTRVITAQSNQRTAAYGRWVAWAFALAGWQILTATVGSML